MAVRSTQGQNRAVRSTQGEGDVTLKEVTQNHSRAMQTLLNTAR